MGYRYGKKSTVWRVMLSVVKPGSKSVEELCLRVVTDLQDEHVSAACEQWAENERGYRKAMTKACSRDNNIDFDSLEIVYGPGEHAARIVEQAQEPVIPAIPDGTTPHGIKALLQPTHGPGLDETRRRDAAVRTLETLGYTWCGGSLWKPPLGKATPAPADQAGGAWSNGVAVPVVPPRQQEREERTYSTAQAAAEASDLINRQVTFSRAREWARDHRVSRDSLGHYLWRYHEVKALADHYLWRYHEVKALADHERVARRLPVKTEPTARPYGSSEAAQYAAAPLGAATNWARNRGLPKQLPHLGASQANYRWTERDVKEFARDYKDSQERRDTRA